MGTQSQQHQRATPPWPHVDHENDIKTSLSEETSYLDEDTVTIVLMQAIMRLSVQSRRKMLMFMHQAEEADRVTVEMTTEPDGLLELRLMYQDG